jgi:hypothetical protein
MLRFQSLFSITLASLLGIGCDVSPRAVPQPVAPAAEVEPLTVEEITSDASYRLAYTNDTGIEYYARKFDGQQRVGEAILKTGGRTFFVVAIKDDEVVGLFSWPSSDNRHIAEKVNGIDDW